jgi:aspartyl-tRNA(Asn)/glutamyl-tRNA(Gln) amidotransferase subunit B
MDQYGLSLDDAGILTATREMADYYEAVVARGVDAHAAANWVLGELTFLLKNSNQGITTCPVTPENLAGMIKLIEAGTISGKIAKTIIEEMFSTGQTAEQVVAEKGLVQISDPGEIQRIIDRILQTNPDEVAAYRGGKAQLLGFFVGQVMRETKGKANPGLVNQLLHQALASARKEEK